MKKYDDEFRREAVRKILADRAYFMGEALFALGDRERAAVA
jgi:hypothetical protein